MVACNDLEDLPRDVVKMEALMLLDVSDNVIGKIPDSICRMTTLRHLNISDNKIMQFPKVYIAHE